MEIIVSSFLGAFVAVGIIALIEGTEQSTCAKIHQVEKCEQVWQPVK